LSNQKHQVATNKYEALHVCHAYLNLAQLLECMHQPQPRLLLYTAAANAATTATAAAAAGPIAAVPLPVTAITAKPLPPLPPPPLLLLLRDKLHGSLTVVQCKSCITLPPPFQQRKRPLRVQPSRVRRCRYGGCEMSNGSGVRRFKQCIIS
jgi:hypothetical protein